MLINTKKIKRVIENPIKLEQIASWKRSDISRASSAVHPKDRASFDATTEFLDNCINFHKDEIEYMLNLGIDIDCSDKDNLTALHQACINVKLDLVIYLLSKKANINAVDKEGWTPLHIAASVGSLELAKCLIDRGARLDMANYDGELPISLVDDKEVPDLKVFFQKEMDKRNINEIFYRNLEKNVMLEDVLGWKSSGMYKPPIDTVNGSTPLHVAASKNYLDIIRELIPLLDKWHLNAQDCDGWTGLHAAAHWGNLDACALLIRAGADMDIVTNANETVLDTIDPDLKDKLVEIIDLFKAENRRNIDLINQVPIRNETANKRRSSIARQSIESKKSTQSKDPLLERQICSNASLNSVSTSVAAVNYEQTDKSSSLRGCDENKNISLSRVDEVDESKTGSTVTVTSPCISDNMSDDTNPNITLPAIHSHSPRNKVNEEHSYNSTHGLSDGDNNSIATRNTANEYNIHNSATINKVAVCDVSDNSSVSDESEKGNSRSVVKMRPKSDRDSIAEHRSVVPKRLSILMAPAKGVESEADRREKARRVRSSRRSTQGIDLESIVAIARRQKQIENGDLTEEVIDERAVDVVNVAIPPPTPVTNIVIDDAKSKVEQPTQLEWDFSNLIPKMRLCSTLDGLMKSKVPSSNIATKRGVLTTEQVTNPITSSNKFSDSRTYARNTNNDKMKSFESRLSSTDSTDTTKEGYSGHFVAHPVPGLDRAKHNNSTPTISHIQPTTSVVTNVQATPVNQHSVTKPTVNTTEEHTLDDIRNLKSIAECLTNDQIAKQELQNEIQQLKLEIQELKDNKDNAASALKNIKTRETDGVSSLESELAKTQEDNRRLRTQNESLLRVISKIQQELESFHNSQCS